METIRIHGGVALRGGVTIQGSKNSSLPILAATLLTGDVSLIRRCPRISDVQDMVCLLQSLGVTAVWERDGLFVDTRSAHAGKLPDGSVQSMRSSLCLLGALLGRFGSVAMAHPGGCVIGDRPIDIHLWALTGMGADFHTGDGMLFGETKGFHGACLTLPKPSVGATENILLAAVLAEGDTRIENAPLEPEIGALCRFLNGCGADIRGIGTRVLTIRGVERLHGADFSVPSDRIVAGTYLFACAATGGCVFLREAPCEELEAVIRVAGQMGSRLEATPEGLYVESPERPVNLPCLRTESYPGFPTDLQSAALAVQCLAKGECRIEETIFENRFRIVEPLRRMGADIEQVDSGCVLVRGVDALRGGLLEARELRGGAALAVAAMAARGESVLTGCSFIRRGYENLCRDLQELGARVVSGAVQT